METPTVAPVEAAPAAPVAPVTPEVATEMIGIDDFKKVELKVATVVEAERIPKADKLLKLIVDLGTEKRQIVSGIAAYYEPEALIGKQVVVVTNLKPVKLRGVESFGMILAAKTDSEFSLVSPLTPVGAGAGVA